MNDLVAALVYLLCFATSSACALLLGRGYLKNRTRLLLWSSACFSFLALNNLLLVVDLLILPGSDLQMARLLVALAGVAVLLFGFIWDLEEDA